nr:cytochrome c [Chloroflexota bacterium]
AEASSPGAAAGAIALGDVSRGEVTFNNFCINCHRPGGTGPDLLAPGGPGTGITVESLTVLLREGVDHPPGPYPDFSIPDSAIPNVAAYIVDGANK